MTWVAYVTIWVALIVAGAAALRLLIIAITWRGRGRGGRR